MQCSGIGLGRWWYRWLSRCMRSVVAILLALTILVSMAPGALMPLFSGSRQHASPDELQLWRDVLMVLIGALAGYLGGPQK